MKKSVIVILALLIVFIAGCKYFPGGSPIPPSPEEALSGEDSDTDTGQAATKEPEAAADDLIKQVAEKKKEAPVNQTNETNETASAPNITGSLDLQDNLTLCPHLNVSFKCNRYDVRRCDFKHLVGQNDYYPDLINCRAGKKENGESPDNRYCLIQECQPLQEDNLVYAYGGPTIFAEYEYSEEKMPDGTIMTYYSLKRCGEQDDEFESDFDCTTFKSELEGLWP